MNCIRARDRELSRCSRCSTRSGCRMDARERAPSTQNRPVAQAPNVAHKYYGPRQGEARDSTTDGRQLRRALALSPGAGGEAGLFTAGRRGADAADQLPGRH